MQIKNISRISFTTRRSAQEKRNLPVRPSMFGEIVIHHERVLTDVAEIFTHGGASIGGNVLQSGRIRGGRSHDNSFSHRVFPAQAVNEARNGAHLLANRDINTNDAALCTVLVNNSIDRDRGLTCLPIANNEFPLTAPNWNHRINGFKTSQEGLINGLASNNTWGNLFNLSLLGGYYFS